MAGTKGRVNEAPEHRAPWNWWFQVRHMANQVGSNMGRLKVSRAREADEGDQPVPSRLNSANDN